MRNRLPIYIMLVCGLLWGCKEKEEVCEDYASADAEISWTDYNSVDEVRNYFDCHSYTLLKHMHSRDTLLVWGYILPRKGSYEYLYEMVDSLNADIYYRNHFYIVSDSTLNRESKSMYFFIQSFPKDVEPEGKDLTPLLDGGGYKAGQKVYIRANVLDLPVVDGGCCPLEVIGSIIDAHK